MQQDNLMGFSNLQARNLLDSVPNELLAKIFHVGTELDRSNELPRSLITYCSVCTRWRAICHHSPELWTNIRIPLRHAHPREVVARTATWLERSKSRLFDLTLLISASMLAIDLFNEQQVDITLVRDVLSVLDPHIPRIRGFHLQTELSFSREAILIFMHLSAYHAPHLRHIHLRFGVSNSNEYAIPMGRINPLTFRTAPQLQHQSVHGADIQYPLHGLTSLHLSHLLPDETNLRYLSMYSPALEELCLTSLHPMVNAADLTQSKIPFPALRSLTVSFARRTFAPGTCILALISPPNLSYFEIRGTALPDPNTSFPNPALLRQLHTLRLEQVVFMNPNSPDVTWHNTSFYLALPSVRHLQLINTSPQPLFPEPEAKGKPLSRSRSGDSLRALSRDSHHDRLLRPPIQANELDFRFLSNQKGEPVKLPFSPENNNSKLRNSSNSYTHWQKLTTVTLDTIRAKDLLWLCELIVVRPKIETVHLSRSAKRHLASSLTMWRGEKADRFSSWDVNLKMKNLVRNKPDVEKGDMDPVQWLEQHVRVYEFHTKDQLS